MSGCESIVKTLGRVEVGLQGVGVTEFFKMLRRSSVTYLYGASDIQNAFIST